jgi:hypothetical protein
VTLTANVLILAPHHGAPEPLLGVGHEAQGQLLGDQAPHQPLRIREVLLAAPGPAIRLRLGEIERTRNQLRIPPCGAGSKPVDQPSAEAGAPKSTGVQIALESTEILAPPRVAGPRLGRRTALTFPLLPPPQ